MSLLLVLPILAAPPTNLVRDARYTTGLGWSLGPARLVADPRPALRFESAGGASQEILLPGVGTYTVAVDVRTAGVLPVGAAGFAFAAVYQLDSHGGLVEFEDFVQLTGDHAWARHSFTFEPHPDARIISLRCGLFQAEGVAEFADWTLVPGDRPAGIDEVAARRERAAPTGRAAILDQPDLAAGLGSSPAVIAAILEAEGLAVDRLGADELAAAGVLEVERYDLVVFPSGRRFPVDLSQPLLRLLSEGGSFINLGGYAFDELLARDGEAWVGAAESAERRLAADLAAGRTPLPDGSFEATTRLPVGGTVLDGRWRRVDEQAELVAEAHDGERCARVTAPLGDGGAEIYCDLPAEVGAWRLSGWLKTAGYSGAGLAFLALYQFNDADEIVAWQDFGSLRDDRDWTRFVYAFNNAPGAVRWRIRAGLYRASGTVWVDDVRLLRESGRVQPLNTATGRPGDGLEVSPLQIGLFDPSAPLTRVARLRLNDGTTIDGRCGGWQAVGVLGEQARWIPLAQAEDRYGRPRGAAAAMIVNHAGLFAGSVWCGFGVDDLDLFAAAEAPAAAALRQAVRFIERGVSLHGLETDRRLYRDGEPIEARVRLRRQWPAAAAQVRFELRPHGAEQPVVTVQSVAGEDSATARFELPRFDAPLYRIDAVLLSAEGEVDRVTTGLVVDRPEQVAEGPALRFADNQLTLGGRSLFLFGTDTYAYTYRSQHEHPLTWWAEHSVGRDFGLNLYENLQLVSPGWDLAQMPWDDFRAMAQLTQAAGLVFMPGMLVGHNVAVGDEALARQSAVVAEYARRLADVPGLLYYINGDYQMRLGEDPAAVGPVWRQWLIDRHGSLEAAAAAWGGRLDPAGDPPAPPPHNSRWDDPAMVDWLSYQTWLTRRWNEAHVAAVRANDAVHPITSEYYQFPFDGMDQRLTIDGQDVSNIGYFDEPGRDLELLPARLAWNDLRARGKGVSLGEYGVKTHPAWAVENGATHYHIVRSEAQQQTLFESIAGYALAYGACKIQNWCLVDSQQRVFPWGMFWPHAMVPKDVAFVHRSLSLLFRFIEPRDEPAAVTVMLPSRLRLGADGSIAYQSAYRAFDTLFGLHCRFQVIDDVEPIPPTTRALLLPTPAALEDDAFARLVTYVEAGGRLLVTGELTLDAMRQPTRDERLERLCGVRLVERLGVTATPALRLEVVDAVDEGGLYRRRLGTGEVLYTPTPLELSDDAEARRAAYARLLDGIDRGPDRPAWLRDARDHLARPTRTGWVHLVNEDRVAGEFTLVHVGDDGGVRLALTSGPLRTAAGELVAGDARYGLLALDGRSLEASAARLITPFSTGSLRLSGEGPWLVTIGDFIDGAWRTYEEHRGDGAPRLEIDEDRRFCLLLLTRPDGQAGAIQTVERMMLRPWEQPGW